MDAEEPIRFRAAGLRWIAEPGFRAGVDELCRRLDDLDADPPDAGPGRVRVKHSTVRTVWRMVLAGRTVFVKRYRVRDARERVKYLFAVPRARAEWRAARALAAAGIEAAAPLAMSVRRDGPWLADALFVAAQLPGVPYADALTALRREGRDATPLLFESVALCERLEAAGIFHPDLHGGNLLVRSEGGATRIGLVDLHAVRLRLTRRRRAAMRAKLAHSLWRLHGDAELDALLRRIAPGSEARLRARIERLEGVRLRSRSRRCVRRSSAFTWERGDGWTIWRRREVPRDALLELSRCAETACVRELLVAGEKRGVWVERRPRGGLLGRWKGLHALRVREIPSPTAYACMQRTLFGRGREALLVTEHLPGARPLERVAREASSPELAAAAASTAARLHRVGLPARAADLLAVADGAGWRVLSRGLESRVPDRPLPDDLARRQCQRLRACAGGSGSAGSPGRGG